MAVSAEAAPSPIHRIIAVGDLHGDFSAWRDIARAAQLVDKNGKWIGKDAVLVQTGDVADRGPDTLKIVQDLMRLQKEAPRAHGQVIALVGNHEAMNVTGDFRYVPPADYAAYADRKSAQRRDDVYAANKMAIEAAYRERDPNMTSEAIKRAWMEGTPLGRLEHQAAWRADGPIGHWVAGNPAVVLLDGTIFVHGGISPPYTHTPIEEINEKVDAALAAPAGPGQAVLNDPQGPLWYRGLAEEVGPDPSDPPGTLPPPPVEKQLETLLPAYDAKRIVIAHTPILSGIAVQYGGRLIRIDTGISSVYDGKVSYLEILDGNPIPHAVERSRH